MNRDPLFEKILARLDEVADGNLFEACACDLLRKEWPTLVPVPGGSDDGVDGSWVDGEERGILVATTNKSVIGNVTKNLKQQAAKGRTGKLVLVVTSRKLSPTQSKNIEQRIRDLGFRVAHQPYERQAIADRLYHNSRWLKELLGLSGNASALSKVPRGLRPLRNLPLVGRENDLKWLCETRGDRLLVGQPGSGKTFLAKAMVDEGHALFVTDDRLDRLADAIRDQEPTAIIVEDAHLRCELLENLRRYREETGATFEIVADCWPGAAVRVRKSLMISNSQCRELNPLSRDKIVELVKAAGLFGPNWLMHQIVRQSVGCPGRAALLVHLCRISSDLSEVHEGRALASWVDATFTELIGERVKPLLAAFAIGGANGTPVEVVAAALGFPIGDVYQAMSQLALGGVVYELSNGVLCVLPEALRSALVADCFFSGPVALPLQPFFERLAPSGSICKALIGAQVRGASISSVRILDLLEQSSDQEAWEAFVWSSEANAGLAFEFHPELLDHCPKAFLRSAPQLVLPQLLQNAVGDD